MLLPPRKYIYRREVSGSRAYYVEFRARRGQGDKRHTYNQKYFGDAKYGGPAAALKAARAWRDVEYRKILRKLGWKRARKRLDFNPPRRNLKWPSLELGVSMFCTRGRPPFWRAAWPGGKRCFGVLGWGYRAGYRSAVETRRRMVGQSLNYPPIPAPPPIPLDVQAFLDGATMEQIRRAKRARKRRKRK